MAIDILNALIDILQYQSIGFRGLNLLDLTGIVRHTWAMRRSLTGDAGLPRDCDWGNDDDGEFRGHRSRPRVGPGMSNAWRHAGTMGGARSADISGRLGVVIPGPGSKGIAVGRFIS